MKPAHPADARLSTASAMTAVTSRKVPIASATMPCAYVVFSARVITPVPKSTASPPNGRDQSRAGRGSDQLGNHVRRYLAPGKAARRCERHRHRRINVRARRGPDRVDRNGDREGEGNRHHPKAEVVELPATYPERCYHRACAEQHENARAHHLGDDSPCQGNFHRVLPSSALPPEPLSSALGGPAMAFVREPPDPREPHGRRGCRPVRPRPDDDPEHLRARHRRLEGSERVPAETQTLDAHRECVPVSYPPPDDSAERNQETPANEQALKPSAPARPASSRADAGN